MKECLLTSAVCTVCFTDGTSTSLDFNIERDKSIVDFCKSNWQRGHIAITNNDSSSNVIFVIYGEGNDERYIKDIVATLEITILATKERKTFTDNMLAEKLYNVDKPVDRIAGSFTLGDVITVNYNLTENSKQQFRIGAIK